MHPAQPDILYRDARFIVLNKPAGLPVHAGPSGRTGGQPSVEDWFPALSRRRTGPWLAHRLDADTAGCLVVALTKTALLDAQATFAAGLADKIYWAIVHGAPTEDAGEIKAPLLKQTSPAGWRMVVSPKGQPARSTWRVLARLPETTLLEVKPRTGRTHQVRVHCATLGCPIVGDPIYGPPDPRTRLNLLARQITLKLNPPLTATAPIPPHMQAATAALTA